MFVDYSDQSNWSAWWPPIVWLFTAAISGWTWTVAHAYLDNDACPSMARSLIVIATFTVVSLLLLTPLRHRRVSLDYTWYYFIGFTVASALSLIVLWCYGWVMLSQVVKDYDSLSLCSNKQIYHTAAINTAWSLSFATYFFCLLVGIVYQRFAFLKPPAKPFGEKGEVRWIQARGFWIPTIFYRASESARDPFTILYSHGNGVDLASSQELLQQMKIAFRCNLMSYEYIGYGPSGGPTTENNCYASLRAAHHLLRTHYRIPGDRIIVWGHSLGTGPTVHLARELSTQNPKGISGVVLQAPLTSIIRTKIPYTFRTCWFDMFANVDKISEIKVPVHIEHGTWDTLVPPSHGKKLEQLAGANSWQPRWWPGVDHNKLPCGVWYVKGRNTEPEGRMSMEDIAAMEKKVETLLAPGRKTGLSEAERNVMDFEHTRLIFDFFAYLRTLNTNTNTNQSPSQNGASDEKRAQSHASSNGHHTSVAANGITPSVTADDHLVTIPLSAIAIDIPLTTVVPSTSSATTTGTIAATSSSSATSSSTTTSSAVATTPTPASPRTAAMVALWPMQPVPVPSTPASPRRGVIAGGTFVNAPLPLSLTQPSSSSSGSSVATTSVAVPASPSQGTKPMIAPLSPRGSPKASSAAIASALALALNNVIIHDQSAATITTSTAPATSTTTTNGNGNGAAGAGVTSPTATTAATITSPVAVHDDDDGIVEITFAVDDE